MSEWIVFETEMKFLPKSEGGRDIPEGYFKNPRYRPAIVIGDPMQRQVDTSDIGQLVKTYLLVVWVDGPQHVEHGISVRTKMASIFYWPESHYDAAVPGATFTFREGLSIIASGTIARRWKEPYDCDSVAA
jgi:hypothetical protein